jgi:hypothetical protein
VAYEWRVRIILVEHYRLLEETEDLLFFVEETHPISRLLRSAAAEVHGVLRACLGDRKDLAADRVEVGHVRGVRVQMSWCTG